MIAVGQTGLLAGTGALPEEAIVGVWKVESAYDENKQEITLSEDEKNLKVVFDENHKAVLIAAGLSLGEGEWKYKKTDINGNMVYSITEGNGDFEIVGPRGKYKEHQGKLLMENDGQVLLLAKSTSEKAGDYTSVTSLDDFVDAVNELAKSVDDIGKDDIVVTQGMKNALKKADEYLNLKAFSRYKLIEQLEYNGFTVDEAEYAADNCGADWNEQAARKAAEYLSMQAFSRERLKEQLRFEGFSPTQIEYGLKQNGY